MEKKDYLKKVLAGVFFIMGVILLVVVILIIGVEKGYTQPKFTVTVLFKSVDGLGIGAPIRFSGVQVGQVGNIDFLDEKVNGRGVKVTLNVGKRYRKHLEKSTRFYIKTEGVLGGKLVDIASDERGPYVDLDWPIIGEDPIDVQDLVGVVTETATAFKHTSETMDAVVAEFKSISESSKRLMNRFEQKLIEGKLFKVF